MKPLVAEIKTQSPFGFKSNYTFKELFDVAEKHGDMISVHTDPRWGGSIADIEKVRSWSDKPILAKGIHHTDEEILDALEADATYVLVVGRMPETQVMRTGRIWIEPLNLHQLAMIPQEVTAVWNSRDLFTGGNKTETWEEARKLFKGNLVQASNIRVKNDLEDDADGYLVGQSLPEFVNSKRTNNIWVQKDGTEILISDMSNLHLENTLKLIDGKFRSGSNPPYFLPDYDIIHDPIELVCPRYIPLMKEFKRRGLSK